MTDLPAAPTSAAAPNLRAEQCAPPAWLVVVVVLAFVARIALLCVSLGTSDAVNWERVGGIVARDGLARAYDDFDCNQPPGQPVWAMLAFRASRATGVRFAPIFKAPLVACDALVVVLLWKVLAPRRDPRPAALAAALYAWSPVAILISAHHGNLDPAYAALALLAVYLIADRRHDLLAGLVLGLAINNKLVPVLLVPALLLAYDERRRALWFFAGLAVMAVPSLIVFVLTPAAFYHRVLAYNSWPDAWGVNYFLVWATHAPALSAVAQPIFDGYREIGKYIVVAAVVLVALVARRRRRRRADDDLALYRLAMCVMALFLILAPGFGLQYLVAVLPLLFVVDLSRAVAYSIAGGAMLILCYCPLWNGRLPIATLGPPIPPHGLPLLFGLLAWLVLIDAVRRAISRRRRWSVATPADTLPPRV